MVDAPSSLSLFCCVCVCICFPNSLDDFVFACASEFTSLTTKKQMAGPRIAHATLKGPSVVKEIIIGITLGLAAGSVWKMHHWNEQRKARTFYDLLEKGEISVVAEEE